MIQNSPRRRVVRFVLAVLCVALAGPGLASSPARGAPKAQIAAKAQATLREEAKSLETLYEDALAEGGELVVYAGGDVAAQQEATVKAFQARFPKIRMRMVVDYMCARARRQSVLSPSSHGGSEPPSSRAHCMQPPPSST